MKTARPFSASCRARRPSRSSGLGWADDVDWTVEGTHPLAGRYHNKQEFIDATFGRLAGVLVGGVRLEVQHLFVDGDTTNR